MNKYGLIGNLKAKEGNTEDLVNILLKASKLVSTAKGCHLYTIGIDKSDSNLIWVTEIWDSKEDHDNSLKLDGVIELISQAIPLLDEKRSKGKEIDIQGGVGIN